MQNGSVTQFARQCPSLTIDTMLNFDGDFDGRGDGDVTCKQTFR